MSGKFSGLIRELSRAEAGAHACNQYSAAKGDLRGNTIRRNNLELYLEQLAALGTRRALVGEAPSHRGGRLTGIPFVSETVLLNGMGPVFGEERGYRKATAGDALSTEASATMVWGTIRDLQPLPLLWNAFPFHPFQPGNPTSNRIPTPRELEAGAHFLRILLELFGPEDVVAIGNQASLTLSRMDIPHVKIRHPSMGGKQKFVEGMGRLSGSPGT